VNLFVLAAVENKLLKYTVVVRNMLIFEGKYWCILILLNSETLCLKTITVAITMGITISYE